MCLLLGLVLFIAGTSASSVALDIPGKTVKSIISVSPSELSFRTKVEEGITYNIIEIPSYTFMTKIGEPMLPVKNIQILIPPDASFDSITIVSSKKEELPGEYLIYPAQPPKPVSNPDELISAEPEIPFVEPNRTIYSSDQPYPGVLVEYIGDGYLAGYHIVTLSIYPLQWVPKTGKLTLYKEIEYEVGYKPSTSQAVKVERRSEICRELYQNLVKSLVENPSDVEIFRPDSRIVDTTISEPFEPSEFPSTCGSIVEYVIITSEPFQDEFQELAGWKTKKGVPTVVKSVSWIEENYPGCDPQEKIRNFIREAYTKWGTQWILLGGDTDIIPDRKAEWGWFGSCNIPTDLYYSDSDGDWNEDGDGYFGEEYDDGVNLNPPIPDLFVGRAPVSTISEALTFVNKIFTYEKNPDLSYITKALLMAVEAWDGQDTKDYIANNYIPDHIDVWELYEIGGDAQFNRDNVLNCMNEGYHFINHIDHSDVDFMGTCCGCSPSGGSINREDMDNLTNDGKFSILWTGGCDPNAFDHDSISEHFILNRMGGGVAFIGNTRAGWTPQNALDKRFFQSIFDDAFFNYSLHHIGMAFASSQALTLMPYSYLTNLLGDPEMPVRTDHPTPFYYISYPSNISIGPNQFSVHVEGAPEIPDPGPPIENALVCLYKEGEVYAYGRTDENGNIPFTLTPETPGTLKITVTAHNYLCREGTIQVSNIAGPYVAYAGHLIDDDNEGSSSGNDDGVVDAGETIELLVALKNTGGYVASGVSATLSLYTPDPYITITDWEAEYGDIPAGESITGEDPYVIKISPECPDEYTVRLVLNISSTTPAEWQDEFDIIVMAPELWHSSNKVYDENGNGVIEPGETVKLFVNVRNSGHGAASGVTGVLYTEDPYIDITCSFVEFGDIPAGGEKTNLPPNLEFKVSDEWPGGDSYFVLGVRDSYDRIWAHKFELTPPEAPIGLKTIPGADLIRLIWEPNSESDLAGYNIYLVRVDDISPARPLKLNTQPVTNSCYLHTNLNQNATYYYNITAIDSSGNESEPSAINERTNPPDQEGWPIKTKGYVSSSPAIVDLDRDSSNGLEVVVGSCDGSVYAWHHDGTDVDGWPQKTSEYTQWGWSGILSSPAVGDIDGDGDLEVVIGAWQSGKVWAWHHDGRLVKGWPIDVEGWVISTPALEDIDPDFPGLEIIVGASNGKVYAWHGDGTDVNGWPADTGAHIYSSPAVGDIDRDGEMEIVIGSFSPGKVWIFNSDGTTEWSVDTFDIYFSSASLGDIDGDGYLEIVAQDSYTIRVWRYDTTLLWSKYSAGTGADGTHSSPSLGDIDDDGDLEIIVGSMNKKVYAWHHDGKRVAGWPKETKCGTAHGTVIADIDGDGEAEILAGSENEKVYAWHKDGTLVKGWPIKTGFYARSTPALGDLDLDGDMEVVVGSNDYKVYAWDLDGAFDEENIEWGTFRHDPRRTGYYPTLELMQPDLVVEGLKVSKESVRLQEEVGIEAKVTNQGRARAERCMISFRVDGKEFDRRPVPELGPGMSVMISTSWKATSPGEHTVSAFVDADNQVKESQEGNNERSRSMWVTTLPDLTVIEFSLSNTTPEVGEAIVVSALLANVGEVSTETRTEVIFQADGKEFYREEIQALGPGSKKEIRSRWIAEGGVHTIEVVVDPKDRIREENERNNKRSIQIEVKVNRPPIANPDGPYRGYVGEPIKFDGSGSYDPDGRIVRYRWNFGDGYTAEGVSVTHTYKREGEYEVCLTVRDDDGATNVDCTRAYIEEKLLPDLTIHWLRVEPREPVEEQEVRIEALVLNNGSAAAKNALVLLLIDGRKFAENTIRQLLPNEGRTLEFRWKATEGWHTITVVADPYNEIEENNEENNKTEEKIQVKPKPKEQGSNFPNASRISFVGNSRP